ncbi:MAG: hypothetical protein U5J78_06800 [Parasphingorhabdus sp.]|nr:hypothetical protein [Parasphingorhabdus sp.]
MKVSDQKNSSASDAAAFVRQICSAGTRGRDDVQRLLPGKKLEDDPNGTDVKRIALGRPDFSQLQFIGYTARKDDMTLVLSAATPTAVRMDLFTQEFGQPKKIPANPGPPFRVRHAFPPIGGPDSGFLCLITATEADAAHIAEISINMGKLPS